MKYKLIKITEKETIELLRKGITVDADFGIGWMALRWEEGEPMPRTVREVYSMRGLLNENMDGAGI
jgi:hypothetical protein